MNLLQWEKNEALLKQNKRLLGQLNQGFLYIPTITRVLERSLTLRAPLALTLTLEKLSATPVLAHFFCSERRSRSFQK